MKATHTNKTKSKVIPVYIRSKENCWVPALQVKTYNGKATVAVPKFKDEESIINCAKASKQYKYHDNRQIDLSDYPTGQLPMQNVDVNGNLEEYHDMVDLPFMHEAAILYNLKLRHIREKPYTRTGDVVIAINPYQWYHELYTEEKRWYYSNRLVWEKSEEDPRATMQPHVYEISALAYRGLAASENQSILVSGESGAGKTETVKICLNHIATVQRGQAPPGYFTDHDPVVSRIIESNPLLEAFGNAQTRRNDNSSRFGKYIQLQFDNKQASESIELQRAHCGLVGSKCDVYLLEKNRVIGHDPVERNFHIFYQLLASPDNIKANYWEDLRGATNSTFKYIGPTNMDTIEGTHDRDRFQQTLDALQLVGVQNESLNSLMQAICIVLQLGNLGFKPMRSDCDKSTVATIDQLEALSSLMGVSTKDLKVAFTERTFQTANESYKVPLNAEAAKDACDALAKEAYQKTFMWLVDKINIATRAEESDGQSYSTIGLLDIFGFEAFPQNRFEQLCINYANEKLQQKFTQDVFKNVQAEYKAEGINLADIHYDDNTDVLDLIEGPTGLLNLLNEECIRPKGNDMDFVAKTLRINANSPCLKIHRTDRLSFGIQHYAGQVMYDAEFFVSKNTDTLPTDLQLCTQKCSNAIIQLPRAEIDVFSNKKMGSRWGQQQSNIVAPTVWTKYKGQLEQLMSNLHQTKSRYIRCIKPNEMKKPHVMEHNTTVDQLRCAGVVASITISRSCFPNRLPNSVVLARYANLWDTKQYRSKKIDGMSIGQKRMEDCKALLEGALKSKEVVVSGMAQKVFAVGKTKTFFRAGALEFLELGRMRGLDSQATTIQRAARGWLARNRGRYDAQRIHMEDMLREAARKAEAERLAQLAREAAERRAARQQALQRMKGQIAALERAFVNFARQQDEIVHNAREKNIATRREIEALKVQYAKDETEGVHDRMVEKAEQVRRIEEAHKLIHYLKKENTRARKDKQRVQVKLEEEQRIFDRLCQVHGAAKEHLDCDRDLDGRVKNLRCLLKAEIQAAKLEHASMKDMVKQQQALYMAEAKKRLRLQKSMAKVLSSVQETIHDRNTVEETVVSALAAESFSKSIMAGLDVDTSEPDLTTSDISEASSVCDSLLTVSKYADPGWSLVH